MTQDKKKSNTSVHSHLDKRPAMFNIVPLIPRYDNAVYGSARATKQRHHPDVQGDVDMELDDAEDEDDGAGPSRITSPGESIASSAAVLRCVCSLERFFVRKTCLKAGIRSV